MLNNDEEKRLEAIVEGASQLSIEEQESILRLIKELLSGVRSSSATPTDQMCIRDSAAAAAQAADELWLHGHSLVRLFAGGQYRQR